MNRVTKCKGCLLDGHCGLQNIRIAEKCKIKDNDDFNNYGSDLGIFRDIFGCYR